MLQNWISGGMRIMYIMLHERGVPMHPDDLRELYRKEDQRREEQHRENFKIDMEERNRIETDRRKEILRLARKGNMQAVFAGLGIPWQPPPTVEQQQPRPMGVSPSGPGPKLPDYFLMTHSDPLTRARARSEAVTAVLNDGRLTVSEKVEYLQFLNQMFQDDDKTREVFERIKQKVWK
jgi:hypothetical protein